MSLEYKIIGQSPVRATNTTAVYIDVESFSTTYARSTDSLTWTSYNTPDSANLAHAAFGNNTFVVLPLADSWTSSTGYTSNDGLTWSPVTVPTIAPNSSTYVEFAQLIYAGGKFIACGINANKVVYSTDGAAWTTASLPASAEWRGISYGTPGYVTFRRANTMAFSSNGTSWTSYSMPALRSWRHTAYGNGVYVVISPKDIAQFEAAAVATSTNGTTWTSRSISNYEWYGLAFGNGVFVTVTPEGNRAAYSSDGITWTTIVIPGNPPNNVIFDGTKFVATSYGTAACQSTDGINWTEVSYSNAATAYSIANTYTPATVYEVPSGKSALVSSIFITESSDYSTTYDLAVVPSGETLSTKHYLRKDTPLIGSQFHIVDTKITLAAGDKIITNSTSSNVSVNVFGVEQ